MALQVGDTLPDFVYVEWQKHIGIAHWNFTNSHEVSQTKVADAQIRWDIPKIGFHKCVK